MSGASTLTHLRRLNTRGGCAVSMQRHWSHNCACSHLLRLRACMMRRVRSWRHCGRPREGCKTQLWHPERRQRSWKWWEEWSRGRRNSTSRKCCAMCACGEPMWSFSPRLRMGARVWCPHTLPSSGTGKSSWPLRGSRTSTSISWRFQLFWWSSVAAPDSAINWAVGISILLTPKFRFTASQRGVQVHLASIASSEEWMPFHSWAALCRSTYGRLASGMKLIVRAAYMKIDDAKAALENGGHLTEDLGHL